MATEGKTSRGTSSGRRTENMQTHRPKLRRTKVCTVKVEDAKGLHNGYYDFADTPDAYVQVLAPQTVEEFYETEVVSNSKNPEFNVEKTFTMKEDDADIEVIVKESNTLLDGEHGRFKGKFADTPSKVQINESATLTMDISCRLEKPHLREGGQLCPEEMQFSEARNHKIRTALRNLLGDAILKSDDDAKTPNIALLGSGGGFRAMMGMCGAFKALSNTGLLDCVKYLAGVSGSSWYLSTLCSHPDWPNVDLVNFNNSVKESMGKNMWDTIMSLKTICTSYHENDKHDRPWTFTDLFGHWIGQTLIPDRMYFKWSDLKDKLRNGDCPLPLLACVRAEADVSTKVFHEWLEISPYEVYMPKYATSVNMKHFGSEFYKGRMTDEKGELPLHYIMGICGSAFTALHKSFSEMSAKSRELARTSRGSAGDMNDTEFLNEGLSSWIDYVKNILDGFGLNYLDDRSGRAALVPNFLRQLTLEKIDEDLPDPENVFSEPQEKLRSTEDYIYLVDAGLVYNSPYPFVLRSGRMVDLIISFEFSDRGEDDIQPFQELLAAKEWADQHKVTFPPIDVEQYKDKPVQEVYVFEDEKDPHCPIIVHFVLVNNHFRSQYSKNGSEQTPDDKTFADFNIFDDGTYDSINFEYTAEQFDRISKLMEFNVHLCLDKVKENIRKAVERREKQSGEDSEVLECLQKKSQAAKFGVTLVEEEISHRPKLRSTKVCTVKIEEAKGLHNGYYDFGICGSAFTALHKSFSEMSAKSRELARTSSGSAGDMNDTDSLNEGLWSWIDYVKNILDGFGLNYLDDRSGRAAMVPNFLRQLTLEKIDEDSPYPENVFSEPQEKLHSSEDYIHLVDAGLVYNSSYPFVLRSGRMVDLIISFEFSDRGEDDVQPFQELLAAKEWADQHKVIFPPIEVDQYKDKPVQDVYVFEDEKDPHCPIIVHFVLVNNHFRSQYSENGSEQTPEDKKFADFNIFDDGIYDSMNFEYTAEQFDRISKLMEFNVHLRLDKVKENIRKAVERREKQSGET